MALSWRVLVRPAGQRSDESKGGRPEQPGSGGGHGNGVCKREGLLGCSGPFSFTGHPGAQSTCPAPTSATLRKPPNHHSNCCD